MQCIGSIPAPPIKLASSQRYTFELKFARRVPLTQTGSLLTDSSLVYLPR